VRFLSGSQQNSFLPRAKLKLAANRTAHGKNSLPNGALSQRVFCREPFVADGNMLFCQSAHGKETFFPESFSSRRQNDLCYKIKLLRSKLIQIK
jgi:hypothetical protein